MLQKITSLPHCLPVTSLNKINEVGLQVAYSIATEVVLFDKLGENEVVEAIDFGTNQQKKLRRSEHPTLRVAGNKKGCRFSIDVKALRAIGAKPIRKNIASYNV
ncbi:MAG: hypothetical protein LBO71_01600 [Prevotellaceae bacterium]|jgi:hypothetical protein|nr:hypothetical protein [Prevotellaceae bacterium]